MADKPSAIAIKQIESIYPQTTTSTSKPAPEKPSSQAVHAKTWFEDVTVTTVPGPAKPPLEKNLAAVLWKMNHPEVK